MIEFDNNNARQHIKIKLFIVLPILDFSRKARKWSLFTKNRLF